MNIEQRQSLLNYFHSITGVKCNPDGVWGPNSQQATKAFQKAYGLPDDGIWGPQTESKIKEAIYKGLKPIAPKPQTQPQPNPSILDKVPEGWEDIKYFKRSEFKCKCGGRYCNGYPNEPSLKLAHLLDRIREHFGRPVTITSGLRCPQHNRNVGGVGNSQHLYGNAADIQVQGVSPAVVANYVESIMPNTGGIGRYNSFTHVDVRPQRARWNG